MNDRQDINFYIEMVANKLDGLLSKLYLIPNIWVNGYISPLYKTWDWLNSAKYRSITVFSCLHKLFTKIMGNRLT